jgi:hypothetical protein
MRKRSIIVGLLLAGLATTPRLWAQSTPQDRAAADALYEESSRLIKEGRFADACAKLEASQKLDPGIGTLLRLGYAYEQLGKSASAWSAYNDAEAAARKAGDKRAEEAAKQAKRIEPNLSRMLLDVAPANQGAGIEIRRDDKVVDPAVWTTAVPVDPGAHTISATKPGKQAWQTVITVEAKPGVTTVRVGVLIDAPEAVPEQRGAAVAQPPERRRFVVEIGGGLAIAPSFGGDISKGCSGGCSAPPAVGGLVSLHAAYELASGIDLGLAGGYAAVSQRVSGRTSALLPMGKPSNAGTADDAVTLGGFTVGVAGGWHSGGRFPVLVRLGAGAFLGAVRDERSGTFHASGGAAYSAGPLQDSEVARFFYLAPEARISWAFADRFELGAGLSALVLVALSRPRWDASKAVVGPDGLARWSAEDLTGKAVLLLVPSITLRAGF